MLATKTVEIVRSFASPGSKRMFFAARTEVGRRAKVIVVGSGRMGHIRSSLIYANPRFELCGIVDVNMQGASEMAEMFGVRNKQCRRQCRPVLLTADTHTPINLCSSRHDRSSLSTKPSIMVL